jgi:hypothetical protein
LPAKPSKLLFVIPAVIGTTAVIGLLGVGAVVYIAPGKEEQAAPAVVVGVGVPDPMPTTPPLEALPPTPALPAIAAAPATAPGAVVGQPQLPQATRAEAAETTDLEATSTEGRGAPQAALEARPSSAPELQAESTPALGAIGAEGVSAPGAALEAPRPLEPAQQAEPEPVAPEPEHAAWATTPKDSSPSSLVAIAAAAPDPPARPGETAAPAEPGTASAPAAADQPPASSDGARAERVFVHHRAGSVAALSAAKAAAAAARRAGLPVMELRTVPATPAVPEVRFFYAADSEAAARLARQLGPAWRVRDFRHYTPPPRTGTLEVWVPNG